MSNAKQILALAALVCCAAVGLGGCCGGSCDQAQEEHKAAPATPSGEKQKEADGAGAAAKLTGPAAAAYAFLEAARRGDDAATTAMLTPTARAEIARLNLSVAPPSSDTARFAVGEVKHVSDAIVHVASRWTDRGADGQPQSHEMTWILRRSQEGWRIGGMATIVFDGEPPLLLDFEKPQEMLRKKQMLREEVARRSGKKNR